MRNILMITVVLIALALAVRFGLNGYDQSSDAEPDPEQVAEYVPSEWLEFYLPIKIEQWGDQQSRTIMNRVSVLEEERTIVAVIKYDHYWQSFSPTAEYFYGSNVVDIIRNSIQDEPWSSDVEIAVKAI